MDDLRAMRHKEKRMIAASVSVADLLVLYVYRHVCVRLHLYACMLAVTSKETHCARRVPVGTTRLVHAGNREPAQFCCLYLCTQAIEDLHKEMADLLCEIKNRAEDIEAQCDELDVFIYICPSNARPHTYVRIDTHTHTHTHTHLYNCIFACKYVCMCILTCKRHVCMHACTGVIMFMCVCALY